MSPVAPVLPAPRPVTCPLSRPTSPRLQEWPVHWRRLPPGAPPRSVRAGRVRDEGGSATVLVLVAVVLLVVATVVGLVLGALATLEHRVESAADLAALAGAAALQGAEDGCVDARAVAARNDASLDACEVHGDVLEVRAVRAVHLPLVGRVPLAARARAGPSGLRPR